MEKQEIILTEVPQNYINITSGLGTATPTFIIIIPIINNEDVHGVIELASFENIDEHKIDFLLKIAEQLGAAIATISNNERTVKLLKDSREMQEQMKQSEEELRQTMEEMEANGESLIESEQRMKEQLEEAQKQKAELEEMNEVMKQQDF